MRIVVHRIGVARQVPGEPRGRQEVRFSGYIKTEGVTLALRGSGGAWTAVWRTGVRQHGRAEE